MSLLKMRDERPVNCRSERVGLFVVDYESNYEILFYFIFFLSQGWQRRAKGGMREKSPLPTCLGLHMQLADNVSAYLLFNLIG